MALSPSIPTSFVPKQPVAPSRRPHSSGGNLFLLVSIIILVIAIAGAGVAYLYSAYLNSVVNSKAAQVQAAENAVNPDTVTQFVRLRNRLADADTILNQHVELSQFFSLLEQITLQNVNYNSLSISVNPDRSASLTLVGSAADFNALAAESSTFGTQRAIKNAIFSGITVNSDNTVAFTVNAALDPSIVIESAPPSTPALLPAPSTGTSTTAAFTNSSVKTAPLATSSASTTSP